MPDAGLRHVHFWRSSGTTASGWCGTEVIAIDPRVPGGEARVNRLVDVAQERLVDDAAADAALVGHDHRQHSRRG